MAAQNECCAFEKTGKVRTKCYYPGNGEKPDKFLTKLSKATLKTYPEDMVVLTYHAISKGFDYVFERCENEPIAVRMRSVGESLDSERIVEAREAYRDFLKRSSRSDKFLKEELPYHAVLYRRDDTQAFYLSVSARDVMCAIAEIKSVSSYMDEAFQILGKRKKLVDMHSEKTRQIFNRHKSIMSADEYMPSHRNFLKSSKRSERR